MLPYIEEQFFDEPEHVKQFELDRLLSSAPTVGDGASDAEELDEDQAARPDTAGVGDGDDPTQPG